VGVSPEAGAERGRAAVRVLRFTGHVRVLGVRPLAYHCAVAIVAFLTTFTMREVPLRANHLDDGEAAELATRRTPQIAGH